MRQRPTQQEIDAAERMAQKAAAQAGHPGLVPNYRMFYLFNNDAGLFANQRDNPYRVARRLWIESNVTIKDKHRKVSLIELNQSQRNKEAIILRAERASVPVRVVTLKVRQNGDSTQTLAIAFEFMLRNCNVKVRLIADKEQLTEELLSRAQLMFRELRDIHGNPWNLQTTQSNRDKILLAAPIYSQLYVISAKVPDPGHGETPDMLCMEETSRWQDAERKAKGVELGLPEVAGSYAFDTSTAFGNSGHYFTKFTKAWDRSQGLATEEDAALLGAGGWKPHFVPWFLHQEYRWSWVYKKPLPAVLHDQIMRTLDDEEKVLLRTRYYLRRKGYCTVDTDQLAWRRYYVSEKCNGSLDTFHEQCPAFPHEAFLASGRPAFDVAIVQSTRAEYMRDPVWTGEIHEGAEGGAPYELVPNARGPFWVWEMPKPGLMYAMGVDTSAGSLKGDPQVFVVIELETCRQVAEFRGWPSPEDFGGIVTRASWLYNGADVGIETHPSPHGLRVYDAAEEYGCKTLYSQMVYDSMLEKNVMKKGWYSTERNKVVLIGMIAVALRDGIEIRSSRLLDELRDAQLDDNEKVSRQSRNDLMVAFGIALKIRQSAYVEGRAPEPEAPRLDFEERFWKNKRDLDPEEPAPEEGWGAGEDELESLYSGA